MQTVRIDCWQRVGSAPSAYGARTPQQSINQPGTVHVLLLAETPCRPDRCLHGTRLGCRLAVGDGSNWCVQLGRPQRVASTPQALQHVVVLGVRWPRDHASLRAWRKAQAAICNPVSGRVPTASDASVWRGHSGAAHALLRCKWPPS